MARVKKVVGDLRARIANCLVKAAFTLYAAKRSLRPSR